MLKTDSTNIFPKYLCLISIEAYATSVQSLNHVRVCDPIDCSMPGFPVHHQLPELSQTHVH